MFVVKLGSGNHIGDLFVRLNVHAVNELEKAPRTCPSQFQCLDRMTGGSPTIVHVGDKVSWSRLVSRLVICSRDLVSMSPRVVAMHFKVKKKPVQPVGSRMKNS